MDNINSQPLREAWRWVAQLDKATLLERDGADLNRPIGTTYGIGNISWKASAIKGRLAIGYHSKPGIPTRDGKGG